jgi:hypothetical protein
MSRLTKTRIVEFMRSTLVDSRSYLHVQGFVLIKESLGQWTLLLDLWVAPARGLSPLATITSKVYGKS